MTVNKNLNPNMAYITKVSDDYWYKIVALNSIETIFKIVKECGEILIEENETFLEKEDFDFWDGMKEEDKEKIMQCKYHITIHDDYLY